MNELKFKIILRNATIGRSITLTQVISRRRQIDAEDCLFVVVPTPGGGGVLRLVNDGDDRRIFFGFEIFDSGNFLGWKIWQVFFWVT